MTDDIFKTVFDVSQAGNQNWWFPWYGLGLLLVGWLAASKAQISLQVRRIFLGLLFLSVIALTSVDFYVSSHDYKNATRALETNSASYVEGNVETFNPLPWWAHGKESFSVHGITFRYSNNIETGGFNNTAAHGGPIINGLYVRIWYLPNQFGENKIIKLQIKK